MAEHHDDDDGRAGQERIEKEQRRKEQNEGYDEAARGGRGVPSSDVGVTPEQPRGPEDVFDREAREAANDVRRRDASAD